VGSMIDKIRAAEERAEEIRAQAVTDARDMVARAREDAASRLTMAADAERQKTREAMAQAETEGKALSAQALQTARDAVAAEEAVARGNLPKAVAYLMERVDAAL